MVSFKLKEISTRKERLAQGHRMCPGCGIAISVRQILASFEEPVVIANATGCLEICSGTFPYSSWMVPWIHSAFPNAASTIAGLESMYRAKIRRGEIPKDSKIKFLAFAGDGGTYDIGFQALSGAVERGHNIVYVCLDNEGYMNTGGQRSSATPSGARTTTSEAGKVFKGKQQFHKDLTRIMAAHHIPYVAQVVPSKWLDLMKKANRAFEVDGPAFINVLCPCPTGWHTDPTRGLEIVQRAVDSCFWPLYEVESGMVRITYKPREKIPVIEWLKDQGRFKHLLRPENEELLEGIQAEVDRRWNQLLRDAGEEM